MSPNIFFKITSSNTNKQTNNVLKTTYRVFDTINCIKDIEKKKISLDKIRHSRLSILNVNTNRVQR